jgi:ABC-type dipeptide/oligopeptide/nickel transport system permease subunit
VTRPDARAPTESVWRRLRRDRVTLCALAFLAAVALAALAAPLVVAVLDARPVTEPTTANRDAFGLPDGPSADHLLGVDDQGRDVLARVLYGARASLLVAFASTGLALVVGTIAGLLAGYYRGWVDAVLSRLTDAVLAFPLLLLALGLASACSLGEGCLGGLLAPGVPVVVAVIAFATWPLFARVVRGQVLSLRERDFVEAARAIGASDARIVTREILPNLAGPLAVYAALVLPTTILFEAALSFLGFGVPAPNPTWGQMIADAQGAFQSAWWLVLFPGLALLSTVLACNLVGDGLRDALDPRSPGTP